MALKPAATNASSNLNDSGSSTVQPKTFPPTTRGGISRLVPPSFRLFISTLSAFTRELHRLHWMSFPRQGYTDSPVRAKNRPENVCAMLCSLRNGYGGFAGIGAFLVVGIDGSHHVIIRNSRLHGS